jgi:hypothetical protein
VTAPDDRELASLLEAERRDDEAAAPPFDAILARSRRPDKSAFHALRQLDIAAAVAALLVAAALVLRSGSAHSAAPATPAAIASVPLAEWQSPTAFLLETPASELLTEVPTFASPLADDGDVAPQPTKGVER